MTQNVKVSPGSQFHSLSQLRDDLPQDALFFPSNPVDTTMYCRKKKYLLQPTSKPCALKHNIFCLVHLSKVVLITAKLSVSNIYLTEKSQYVALSFYETHKESPKRSITQARQANLHAVRAIVFSAFVTSSWMGNKKQIDFPIEQMIGLLRRAPKPRERAVVSKEVNSGYRMLCSLVLPCSSHFQWQEHHKNNNEAARQYG